MNRESPDPATDLVLEGLPPGSGRPSWLALIVAVVVALLVGSVIGYGIGKTPAATLAALGSPSPSTIPADTPSATPSPAPSGDEVQIGLLKPGTHTVYNVDGKYLTNLRFTVPAGWTWNGRYLSKGGSYPSPGASIFFFDGDVQVYADPCDWAGVHPHPPSGPAVADLMAALAAQPMRRATKPAVRNGARASFQSFVSTPGQWQGMSIQLTVPDHVNFADCDNGQFRSWGPDPEVRTHEGPGQVDLVWAMGLGRPERLIVDAAWFPLTPADIRSEIEPILRSIAVGHWG